MVPSRIKSFQEVEMERRLKDTAEDVFCTLFRNRADFQDTWSMCLNSEGEFESICQTKCIELMKSYDTDSNDVYGVLCDSPGELMRKIKIFLTKVKGEPCLWPPVDNITIRLQHDLLQQGLELIDLPGTSFQIGTANNVSNIYCRIWRHQCLSNTTRRADQVDCRCRDRSCRNYQDYN